MAAPLRGKTGVLVPLCLFVAAVASRLPFTSRLLYHMDSVQYALGLDRYNIALHQPHPPGYYVYIVLGRIMHRFVADPNQALVALSILFTAGTVVVVYLLAQELSDDRTAFLASLCALTSPNLWFHGEIAMNYGLESFFSASIAYTCWKLHLHRQTRHLLVLALLLGLAGGIRQNTPVFLLPLALFACRNLSTRSLLAGAAALGSVSLAWFLSMTAATGGWSVYWTAFRELWRFHTGHHSVFEAGIPQLALHGRCLVTFITYGIGGGTIILLFSLYVLIRRRKFHEIGRDKALFFSCWIMPAFLFYLLIFIHPANPGYLLVITPPLYILTAQAISCLHRELDRLAHCPWHSIMAFTLVCMNLYLFLWSDLPVSRHHISKHDRDLGGILRQLRKFSPETTVLFVQPYVFYGFRHVMYYLPEYLVCSTEPTSGNKEHRDYFAGRGRRTVRLQAIVVTDDIREFATPVISDDSQRPKSDTNIRIDAVNPWSHVASGRISHIIRLYPELPLRFRPASI